MLKFLIILVCVFFFLRIIGRFFIVSTFDNLNKKMQDQMNRGSSPKINHPEGHITIEKNLHQQRKNKSDDDFADYEEIK